MNVVMETGQAKRDKTAKVLFLENKKDEGTVDWKLKMS